MEKIPNTKSGSHLDDETNMMPYIFVVLKNNVSSYFIYKSAVLRGHRPSRRFDMNIE